MSISSKTRPVKLPLTTIMSFWRSRLNKILRQDTLLRRIIVHGNRLSFEAQSWNEYWAGTFLRVPGVVKRLHDAWHAHRVCGFSKPSGQALGAAYMEAIGEATKGKWSVEAKRRLLSFENTAIYRASANQPLAAMTANFRHPVILLRHAVASANVHHNETLLLPLMSAGDGDETHVFFHYRRQNLLRNTNDALLFFPRVDLSARGDSFRILQELVEVLVQEWDSRIEQRANLLSEKVILPLMPGLSKSNSVIKLLDVGSGAGLFTSRLIKRVCQSESTSQYLFDLTLLDQLAVDPGRYFREYALNKRLADLRYISSDYAEGVQELASRISRRPAFELVLLLRILHNISTFTVSASPMESDQAKTGRYGPAADVSNYFRLLAHAFPCMMDSGVEISRNTKVCWLPQRTFNRNTLVLPNGKSLIDAIARIGRVAIIEDGDLMPGDLEQHRKDFGLDDVVVHDLSHHLRLSTNHVYVISKKGMGAHLGGGAAWLN